MVTTHAGTSRPPFLPRLLELSGIPPQTGHLPRSLAWVLLQMRGTSWPASSSLLPAFRAPGASLDPSVL